MNQRGRRATLLLPGIALGIVLAIGLVDRVRDDGSGVTEPQAAMNDATESRTPIEVASLGPQIGERVPDFSLRDQNGELHTLDDIVGRRGAMLLFYRSADW